MATITVRIPDGDEILEKSITDYGEVQTAAYSDKIGTIVIMDLRPSGYPSDPVVLGSLNTRSNLRMTWDADTETVTVTTPRGRTLEISADRFFLRVRDGDGFGLGKRVTFVTES